MIKQFASCFFRELGVQNSPHMVDLDFGEVEDVDIGGLELKSVSPVVQKALKPTTAQSTPIDLKTAIVCMCSGVYII